MFYFAAKTEMLKGIFKESSSSKQLIVLLILTLSLWLVSLIMGSISGFFIWGNDILNSPEALVNSPGFISYIQILQSIGLFIAPPFLFWHLTDSDIEYSLNKTGARSLVITLSVLIIIISQPFISFLGILNNNIQFPEYLYNVENWMREKEALALETTKVFLQADTIPQTLLNVFIIAFLPAIGEELMFRGTLQPLFSKIFNNQHLAIWITAILFSAIHVQFFGFLPRLVLGAIFGYLFVYGKSIFLPIIAHFTNNLLAFIIYQWYLNNPSEISNPLEVNNEYPNMLMEISSLGIVVLIIFFLRRKAVKA